MDIKPLTTLIFDLDGTLCHYTINLEEALLQTFGIDKVENLPLTPEEYQEGFGGEFDRAVNGTVDSEELGFRTRIFYTRLKEKSFSRKEIVKLGERFRDIREKSLTLYPEAEPLFDKLIGKFKLGLLTNGPSSLQRRKIEKLEIESWFDSIVVSGEHNMAKPDPRIFRIALDELDSNENNSIYIGNSLQYDVLGANNAGLPVVWKKDEEADPCEEAKPDLVINVLSELIDNNRSLGSSEKEKRRIKT